MYSRTVSVCDIFLSHRETERALLKHLDAISIFSQRELRVA